MSDRTETICDQCGKGIGDAGRVTFLGGVELRGTDTKVVLIANRVDFCTSDHAKAWLDGQMVVR